MELEAVNQALREIDLEEEVQRDAARWRALDLPARALIHLAGGDKMAFMERLEEVIGDKGFAESPRWAECSACGERSTRACRHGHRHIEMPIEVRLTGTLVRGKGTSPIVRKPTADYYLWLAELEIPRRLRYFLWEFASYADAGHAAPAVWSGTTPVLFEEGEEVGFQASAQQGLVAWTLYALRVYAHEGNTNVRNSWAAAFWWDFVQKWHLTHDDVVVESPQARLVEHVKTEGWFDSDDEHVYVLNIGLTTMAEIKGYSDVVIVHTKEAPDLLEDKYFTFGVAIPNPDCVFLSRAGRKLRPWAKGTCAIFPEGTDVQSVASGVVHVYLPGSRRIDFRALTNALKAVPSTFRGAAASWVFLACQLYIGMGLKTWRELLAWSTSILTSGALPDIAFQVLQDGTLEAFIGADAGGIIETQAGVSEMKDKMFKLTRAFAVISALPTIPFKGALDFFAGAAWAAWDAMSVADSVRQIIASVSWVVSELPKRIMASGFTQAMFGRSAYGVLSDVEYVLNSDKEGYMSAVPELGKMTVQERLDKSRQLLPELQAIPPSDLPLHIRVAKATALQGQITRDELLLAGKVSMPHPSSYLLCGPPNIGKSSLVGALHGLMCAQRGYQVEGTLFKTREDAKFAEGPGFDPAIVRTIFFDDMFMSVPETADKNPMRPVIDAVQPAPMMVDRAFDKSNNLIRHEMVIGTTNAEILDVRAWTKYPAAIARRFQRVVRMDYNFPLVGVQDKTDAFRDARAADLDEDAWIKYTVGSWEPSAADKNIFVFAPIPAYTFTSRSAFLRWFWADLARSRQRAVEEYEKRTALEKLPATCCRKVPLVIHHEEMGVTRKCAPGCDVGLLGCLEEIVAPGDPTERQPDPPTGKPEVTETVVTRIRSRIEAFAAYTVGGSTTFVETDPWKAEVAEELEFTEVERSDTPPVDLEQVETQALFLAAASWFSLGSAYAILQGAGTLADIATRWPPYLFASVMGVALRPFCEESVRQSTGLTGYVTRAVRRWAPIDIDAYATVSLINANGHRVVEANKQLVRRCEQLAMVLAAAGAVGLMASAVKMAQGWVGPEMGAVVSTNDEEDLSRVTGRDPSVVRQPPERRVWERTNMERPVQGAGGLNIRNEVLAWSRRVVVRTPNGAFGQSWGLAVSPHVIMVNAHVIDDAVMPDGSMAFGFGHDEKEAQTHISILQKADYEKFSDGSDLALVFVAGISLLPRKAEKALDRMCDVPRDYRAACTWESPTKSFKGRLVPLSESKIGRIVPSDSKLARSRLFVVIDEHTGQDIQTAVGDCGGCVVADGAIRGFHAGSRGVCVAIDVKIARACMASLMERRAERVVVENGYLDCPYLPIERLRPVGAKCAALWCDAAVVVGTDPMHPRSKTKFTTRKALGHEIVVDDIVREKGCDYACPSAERKDIGDGRKFDPIDHALAAMGEHTVVDVDRMWEATTLFIADIDARMGEWPKLQPDALQTVVDRAKGSTSSGRAWREEGMSPKTMFIQDDGKLDPVLVRAIAQQLGSLREGVVPSDSQWIIKDEKISEKKAAVGDGRAFELLNCVTYFAGMILYGPIQDLIRANPRVFECALGMKVFSGEWRCLVEAFSKEGGVICLDGKKWDKRFRWTLKLMTIRVFAHIARRVGYSPMQVRMLVNQLAGTFIRFAWINGDVVFLMRASPSGEFSTTETNSFGESIALRGCVVAELGVWDRDNYYTRTFGDDLYVKQATAVFTQLAMAKWAPLFGIEYTSCHKGEALTAFETPERSSFLKRSPVWRDGRCLPALEKASIWGMLGWETPGPGGLTPEMRFMQVANNAVKEAWCHGPEFRALVESRVRAISEKYDVPVVLWDDEKCAEEYDRGVMETWDA